MSSQAEVGAALASFRHGVESGRLAQAYLVVGNPRAEAREFAEQALATLYCGAPKGRPCGACDGCRQADGHTHPDLLWIEPQKRSRTIQKEQIQAIQQAIFQTSFAGGWKSVVLVSADRLSDYASNRLLKTLEEPAGKSIFFLLTDVPEALLPTVVSRCQRVALNAGAENDPAYRALVVEVMRSHAGRGVLGAIARARLLTDTLKRIRKEQEAAENDEAEGEEIPPELREDLENRRLARIEARCREIRASILRWLLFWQRDALICLNGGADRQLYFPEEAALMRKTADGLTWKQALDNIRAVEEMKSQLEQHLPEPMVFERGFIRLAGG